MVMLSPTYEKGRDLLINKKKTRLISNLFFIRP